MIGFDAVLRLIGDLEPDELRRWIAEHWVRPESEPQGYVFHEVDVARVRLIHELRHDLAIDEETLPVVLGLLDQIYALRRRLARLQAMIEEQPPEIRAVLRARFGEGQ
jgi:chaperone modulatory protein CbpM